jgi:hypothetical protein
MYLVESEEAKEGNQNGEAAHHGEDLGCVQVQAVPVQVIFANENFNSSFGTVNFSACNDHFYIIFVCTCYINVLQTKE